MYDETFKNLLNRLKEEVWYYIKKIDDWDRYLYEVYAKHELMCIVWNRDEAYMKLWEFVQSDLSEK